MIDDLKEQNPASKVTKEENKAMQKKLQDYRASVRIFEKTVTDLGSKVPDMKTKVPKILKRDIEQTEKFKEPLIYPQKRSKNGDDSAKERSKTSVKTRGSTDNLSRDQTHSPRLLGLSYASNLPSSKYSPLPSTPDRHHVPVPKAKRANFSSAIPFGLEEKFATTRLAQPNKFRDITGCSSHVTAIFQGLTATVKTHELWSDLPEAEKQYPNFWKLYNYLTATQVQDEVSQQQNMPTSRAFIDSIADAQEPHVRSLMSYSLQCHLETVTSRTITDPVKYLEQVLSGVSTLSLA